ncbi:MAG: B12-binding domain-containing protein [Actinomycetota bacterium]
MTVETDGLSEARLAVTAAAVSGDAGTMYRIVSGLMGEGVGFDAILFDLLVPAEQDVGARWQSGDYLVSEEHAATATVETVVSLLAGSLDRPEDGLHVVVAAAEGDDHSLPGRVVAAHLLFLGYRTTYLGGNVLASDLGEYLEVEPPRAMVLSCAMTTHLPGARAAIRAAHAVGVPVVAGGSGFGEGGRWAAALGADAWAPTPREVAGILSSWDPDPREAEAAAADPSPRLRELLERHTSVLASACRRLEPFPTPSQSRRLTDELSLLLGAVEASLLVGDDRVISDMARWQRATLAAHGYDSHRGMVDALEAALGETAPEAEAALTRATASL